MRVTWSLAQQSPVGEAVEFVGTCHVGGARGPQEKMSRIGGQRCKPHIVGTIGPVRFAVGNGGIGGGRPADKRRGRWGSQLNPAPRQPLQLGPQVQGLCSPNRFSTELL